MVAKTGVHNRALIPVGGKTMLDCVVSAFLEAPVIEQIFVVGDLPASKSYRTVGDHGGFVENLYAGLDDSGTAPLVVISTADVPFLTSEAVEDLVERGRELDAEIVYPIVPVEACYDRFPGIKRTAVKLRGGRFTGGNLILARPEFLLRQRAHIAAVYGARKSPLKIARMLGIGTVLRFAGSQTIWPGLLNIAGLERTVSRMVGGKARALISPFPEIATDIDRVEDLEAIEGLWR